MPSFLSGYSKRKLITINHSYISSSLTDFPLLVKLSSDSDIGAAAASNGQNIRFTQNDGTTLLKYERQSFSITSGAATGGFWVKIPSISSVSDTTFYIYYDNSGASDGQDKVNTWDSNFNTVYHLEESGNGTSGEFKDSTTNAINGQGGSGTASAVPTQVTGITDNGQSFDGGDFIALGTGALVNPNNNWTMETWYKGTDKTLDQLILSWGQNTTGKRRSIWLTATNGYYTFSGFSANVTTTNAICDGIWHHLAITCDSSNNIVMYKDGSSVATGTPALVAFTTAGSFIGKSGNASEFSKGTQDETRISTGVRTAAWLSLTYNNIFNNASTNTIGTEESVPQAVIQIFGKLFFSSNKFYGIRR